MLSEAEQNFILYWERVRLGEQRFVRQLLVGIPIGMLVGIPILVVLFSGRFWYVRADAVAGSRLSPVVLIVAVLLIVLFMAFFYKRHQWEMKEQYYQELLVKKKKSADLDEAAKTNVE
jgi:uncharacterized membrane protein